MGSAVRVRVVEPVAVQTQTLGAGGALSVNSRDAADAAGFYGDEKKPTLSQIKLMEIKAAIMLNTLFVFLCLFSLVIGSGGVTVTEVVTRITERLIVTGRTNHR